MAESEPAQQAGGFGVDGNADEASAASRIQSTHRGKQARRELQEKQQAVVKVQAAQRGRQTRRKNMPKDEMWQRIAKCRAEDLIELLFTVIDTDGDGELSQEEVRVSPFGTVLAAHWTELDKSSDMSIDKKEWLAFFEDLLQKLGKGDHDMFIFDLCWSGDLDVSVLLSSTEGEGGGTAPPGKDPEPEPEPAEMSAADYEEAIAAMEREHGRLETLLTVRTSEIARAKGRLATLNAAENGEFASPAAKGSPKKLGAHSPRAPTAREVAQNEGMFRRELEFKKAKAERQKVLRDELAAAASAELTFTPKMGSDTLGKAAGLPKFYKNARKKP